MKNFNIGNRVEVIHNGLQGEIRNVDQKNITILWDHFQKEELTYPIDDIQNLWFLTKDQKENIQKKEKTIESSSVCCKKEDLEEYQGFVENFKFCKKCDKKHY